MSGKKTIPLPPFIFIAAHSIEPFLRPVPLLFLILLALSFIFSPKPTISQSHSTQTQTSQLPTCTTDSTEHLTFKSLSKYLTPSPYSQDPDYLISYQNLILMLALALILGYLMGRLKLYFFSLPYDSEPSSPIQEREDGSELHNESSPMIGSDNGEEQPAIPTSPMSTDHTDLNQMIDDQTFLKNFYDHEKIEQKLNYQVFTASHLLDKETYMIKKILLGPFNTEAILANKSYQDLYNLKKLNSKYIARYITSWLEHSELNHDNVNLCVQMEVYTDRVLKRWLDLGIQNKRPCYKIFKQLLKGLKHIHEKGLSHGNLRSKNIYLDRCRNVKLSHFRLGRLRTDLKASQAKDIVDLAVVAIELFMIFRSKDERKEVLERFRNEFEVPAVINKEYEEIYKILKTMASNQYRTGLLDDILAYDLINNAI